MEAKKNPALRLDRWRSAFFQIGLIMSILFVISAFEWEFEESTKEVTVVKSDQVNEMLIPITEIPPPEPPKPKVVAKTFIEVVEEDEIEIPEFDLVIDQEEILDYTPDIVVPEIEEEVSDQPFLIVEDMPVPNGGYEAFYKYVGENLNYPSKALRLGLEGMVYVQFVVDEGGKVTNAIVLKGFQEDCNNEALRVIEGSPTWSPGKQRGKEVKVQIVVPIRFALAKK